MTPDTQWPSEDEDFDAVTDSKSVKTATVSEPERKLVAVVSDDEASEKDSETEPETEKVIDKPESPEEPEAVAEAVPDPEPEPAEPQPEISQSETNPASPVVAAPTVSVSKKTPKGHLLVEIILLIALIGVALWAFTQYSNNKTLTTDNTSLKKQITALNSNPQIAIQKQTNDLISKVGALMQLPTGESPTIANVSDVTAAKKQSAFFNNAQNGDKVLMYVKAGQAILYRPDTNKIILVAPLTFNSSSTSSKTTQ